MRNKSIKILIILLVIIFLFSLNIHANSGDFSINDWKPNAAISSNTKLTTLAGKILGIIQVVGSIVSVIVLVIIGIKYMLGSIEEKAKYKETMIPYIIGCVLVFATSNIAHIIYNFSINIG